jgi:hypothetical protein
MNAIPNGETYELEVFRHRNIFGRRTWVEELELPTATPMAHIDTLFAWDYSA